MNVELRFGEWLEDQLEERGLTHQDLADALGINRTTVTKWISGPNKPRRTALDKLAEMFGIDRDEVYRLAGREPAPERRDGMPVVLRPTPATIRVTAANVQIGQAEFRLPILGYVPADSNRETEGLVGRTLPVLAADVAHLSDPVVFIATGECLLRRGIEPGTRVIVDRGARPENGEVVVVQTLDGYTMKEWALEGAEVVLRASEPGYAPIRLRVVDEGDAWHIVGVVRLRYGLDRV